LQKTVNCALGEGYGEETNVQDDGYNDDQLWDEFHDVSLLRLTALREVSVRLASVSVIV
jgi:hypothetical protein